MGGMDSYIGGPSAMRIYNSGSGTQGQPPDTGLNTGAALNALELAHRQRYATPAVPGPQLPPGAAQGPGRGQVPLDYNLTEGMPVKYSVPSAAKENLATREIVRNAIQSESNSGQVIRTDPITEEEVAYVKHMKDQAEVADLDRYVNVFFDPRKPGNMNKLMEIYPEFVNRRIQQTKTDYEYALRSQMIDQWGVNTFDDLLFLYWRDQGKISGPNLTRQQSVDHQYTAGYLSPFYWGLDTRSPTGLKMPFASARYGKRPDNPVDWALPDSGQPLTEQRNVQAYAEALYNTDASVVGGAAGYSEGLGRPGAR